MDEFDRDPIESLDFSKDSRKMRRTSKKPINTFWKTHHKKFKLGIVALFGFYLLIEGFYQFRIQMALKHTEDGEYEKAMQSVNKRFGLFRHKVAEAVSNKAQYHLAIKKVNEAVTTFNWYVAQKNLGIAIVCSSDLEVEQDDILMAIESWHGSLNAHLKDGDLAKCREALDHLTELSFHSNVHKNKVDQISYETTLNLLKGFTRHEAWIPALKEAKIAEDHPLAKAEEVTKLMEIIHQKMVNSMKTAMTLKEFERAEAIHRLIETKFPDRGVRKDNVLSGIKFSKAIAKGKEYELNQNFDKALESYDRALQMKPGSLHAFSMIRNLRQHLKKFSRSSGRWEEVVQTSSGNEFEEAQIICDRMSKRSLYRSGRPKSYDDQYLTVAKSTSRSYSSGLSGRWSLKQESYGGTTRWLIRGTISAPSRSYRSKAFGGIKVGMLIVTQSGEPLTGKVLEVPFLLMGEKRDFEAHLPSISGEHSLIIAMKKP